MTALISKKRPKRLSDTIPAGATRDLDTIPFSEFTASEYLARFFNDTEAKHAARKMIATKKGVDVEDSVFGHVGSPLDVSLNFVVDGSDAVLRATNNEAFEVSFTGLRTPF